MTCCLRVPDVLAVEMGLALLGWTPKLDGETKTGNSCVGGTGSNPA